MFPHVLTVRILISATYIWQRRAMGFARLPSFEFGNFIFGRGFAAISPARQVFNLATLYSAKMRGDVAALVPKPPHFEFDFACRLGTRIGQDWVVVVYMMFYLLCLAT